MWQLYSKIKIILISFVLEFFKYNKLLYVSSWIYLTDNLKYCLKNYVNISTFIYYSNNR